MLNDQTSSSSNGPSPPNDTTTANQNENDNEASDHTFRDIHPLTPPPPPPPPPPQPQDHLPGRRREAWETGSTSSSSENFTTMSREFSALVLAGSAVAEADQNVDHHGLLLARIGEEDYDRPPEEELETNPLAIVPDNSGRALGGPAVAVGGEEAATAVQRVKKEEVEAKISAWQNAKAAKINNRFKREDALIAGWESEQLHNATSSMKKVERKLEEKRARALEKMQNDVAKARRKAEERRASAEAKRGTKVARVLEIANLMRAVGRPPAKRSFF